MLDASDALRLEAARVALEEAVRACGAVATGATREGGNSALPLRVAVVASKADVAGALGPEAASEALGVGALSGVGEEGVHVRLWSASAHTDTGVATAGEALAWLLDGT